MTRLALLLVLVVPGVARAQAPPPVSLLDVPYISQSELLCGGAAAAMVLRYWGERAVTAESFAPLVDRRAGGIRSDALAAELSRRGWQAAAIRGDAHLARAELARGRPVLALIEARAGVYHYVVLVAWLDRGIVLHDPAQAPFQVMAAAEFARRWRAAQSWMLVVTPGVGRAGDAASIAPAAASAPVAGVTADGGSCEQLVADGVAAAGRGDLEQAERSISGALACPGGAAARELAGVRLLQRRWPEVALLAAAAAAVDPADAHAWRLLGTARFVQDDRDGALAAWNRVGEPTLDVVAVDGLARTRHRVVEQALGLLPGAVLTPADLRRARRRLGDLPALAAARLDVVPAAGGVAELRGVVVERPRLPAAVPAWIGIGLGAAARGEVRLASASPSGGGERIEVGWRFWRRRPQATVSVQSPVGSGFVAGVALEVERQPFDVPAIPTVDRRRAALSVGRWEQAAWRWEAEVGFERRAGAPTRATFGGGLTFASPRDRVTSRVSVTRWAGAGGFTRAEWSVRGRSRQEPRTTLVVGSAAVAAVGGAAPLDLWPAGDTGPARPVLLRAHPALDAGALRVDRLGRRLGAGSLEIQRWWRGDRLVRAGLAAFVDVGRTGGRRNAAARTDVDAGVGLRLWAAGLPGVVRLDVGRGLRDGALAVSVGYAP